MKMRLFNKVADTGINQFDPSVYEFSEDLDTYDVIVVCSTKLYDMEFPAGLRCITRAGAGASNIPLDRYGRQGIVVFNMPGTNANAVKELVVAGLLMSSRKITEDIEWVKTLEGDDISKAVERGRSNFVGPEIAGKELGIIEFGAIGVLVANATAAMDMEVFGYDLLISVKTAWTLKTRMHHVQNPKWTFEKCDYMAVHVPLSDKAASIIDVEAITTVKSDVCALNSARGSLIDDEVTMKTMDEGEIAAYTADFPTRELLQYEQMIGVPHLGASAPGSEENCAVMTANEIIEYLEMENITHSVNLPDMQLTQEYKYGIYIIDKSVPDVVGVITTTLTNVNVNIENMTNKGKKGYVYVILDTNDKVSKKLMERLRSREGTINARLITAKA